MAMITIDTETQSLNTHNFIMGAIAYENGTTEAFRNKTDMWNKIQELLNTHRKKKTTLLIYAHNMHYDFLAIKPAKLPKNYHLYCGSPFIMDVRDQNRIYGKFLSTTSLYRGSLANMGTDMGRPKTETPEWLKRDTYEPDFLELAEAERYMVNDAQIVLQYMQRLRKFLKSKKIGTRWLLTSGQIGINYLLQNLRKHDAVMYYLTGTWYNDTIHPTKYNTGIRGALRGGRVEAFHFGHIDTVSSIDINSHYPHALATFRTPDLQSERLIQEPLNTYDRETLLSHIGISQAKITVKKGKYGVLPIRLNKRDSCYPNNNGQILIGTWTHTELEKAVENGYTIQNIQWSILWDEAPNPFGWMKELAQERLNAEDDLEKGFLKMLMNSSIGKFAQRTPNSTYEWTEVGFAREHELQAQGYEAVAEDGRHRLYELIEGHNYPKFYAPALNALVTAEARIRLLNLMEELPPESVHYVDTDGIVADAKAIQNAMFKYSNNLGGLKLETEEEPAFIYSRKGLMIGENIRLSGISKNWVTPEAFRAGTIRYKRMRTAGNTHNQELIGTFSEHERDLHQSMKSALEHNERVQNQKAFIDDYELRREKQWDGMQKPTTDLPT